METRFDSPEKLPFPVGAGYPSAAGERRTVTPVSTPREEGADAQGDPVTDMPFDPDAPGSGEGIFGLPHGPDGSAVILVPIPWEATVSYGSGTHLGPEAILEASQQVDLYDLENGRFFERGIHMLGIEEEIRDWGREARGLVESILAGTDGLGLPAGIDPRHPLAVERDRVDSLGAQLNVWLESECDRWRSLGKLGGVVGGDHSSPFGSIRSAARAHGELGILQIDAHADLREAYMGFTWSHASIFFNVLARIPEVSRLVQVGIRDLGTQEARRIEMDPERIRTFFDFDLETRRSEGQTWNALCREIVDALPRQVYVSFDIDGLDPSLCPHTGTPVPGGLTFFQASSLISQIVTSGRRIVGFDLCEVAPAPSGDSEWDANVGARLLYKLVGHALRGW